MDIKIKKFENYKIDYEDEIAVEYAKLIISKYIDEESKGKTLEDIFYETGKDEFEFEEHDYIVKQEMIDFLYNTLEEARNIKSIEEISAKKFNL